MRSERTLYMANHPAAPRMAEAFIRVNRRIPDMVYVCDALFSPFLEKVGMKTIGVDTRRVTSRNPYCRARIKLVHALGNALGLYDNGVRGSGIVDSICERLDSGNNVFICPSGISDDSAPWKCGVGDVAIRTKDKGVHSGFIFIPHTYFISEEIQQGPVLGSFLPESDGAISPRRVAKILENEFRERFPQIEHQ